MKKPIYTVLIALFVVMLCISCSQESDRHNSDEHEIKAIKKVALTLPMDWNSFDAYDCRINEEEFNATVDFMADNLLEHG